MGTCSICSSNYQLPFFFFTKQLTILLYYCFWKENSQYTNFLSLKHRFQKGTSSSSKTQLILLQCAPLLCLCLQRANNLDWSVFVTANVHGTIKGGQIFCWLQNMWLLIQSVIYSCKQARAILSSCPSMFMTILQSHLHIAGEVSSCFCIRSISCWERGNQNVINHQASPGMCQVTTYVVCLF